MMREWFSLLARTSDIYTFIYSVVLEGFLEISILYNLQLIFHAILKVWQAAIVVKARLRLSFLTLINCLVIFLQDPFHVPSFAPAATLMP